LASENFLCWRIQEISPQDANFEALSYTWGTAPRDLPATVVVENGEARQQAAVCIGPSISAVCIGPSLYAGLRRLRHSYEKRLWWINQLCINQDDENGMSQQVLLRGDIYSKAQQTIVWLGEEHSDKEILEETAALFAACMLNNWIRMSS
jgi:hypothetical protein